jgi:predicted RND superfamily exporter protein
LWRRVAAVLVAAVVAAMTVAGLLQVKIDTGISSFLPAGDPAYQAMEDKANSFGSDPVVVLLDSAQSRELFTDQEKLSRLLALEGTLSRLPNVAGVYGPATMVNQIAGSVQNVLAQISGRRDAVVQAAEDEAKRAGKSAAAIDDAGRAAQASFDQRYGPLVAEGMPAGLPTLRNPQFVSTVLFDKAGQPQPRWHFVLPTDHTVAILVRPRADLDQDSAGRLVTAVRSAADQAGLGAKDVKVSGVSAIMAGLSDRAQSELPVLGAIAVAAVGIIFLLAPWSRRRRSRVRPLLCALTGTALTAATFGWLHHPLSLGVVAFLPILMGIASDFPFYLSQPGKPRRALVTSMAGAAAFASLALSPLPFVRELGLALAGGMLVTVGVALLSRRWLGVVEPPPPARRAPAGVRVAGRWPRVAAGVVLILLAGFGWAALPRLGIESSPEQLAKGVPELPQAQDVEQALGSSGEVSIELRGKDVLTPEAFAWTRQAEDVLVRNYGDQLRPVITTADLTQFLGTSPTKDEITSAMNLMPSYLTSAVMLPNGSAALMIFGVKLQDLEQQRVLLDHVRAALPPAPKGTDTQLVGLPVVGVRGLDLVSESKVLVNVVGIVAAILVLLIALRRRADAARAGLTVLLATGWVLGLVWVSTGALNPLTVAIGSLTTATGCEFAVMLAGAVRAGKPMLRTVGTAALAGAAGYLALAFSGLAVLRTFGILLSAGVVLSFLAASAVVWLFPPGADPPPGEPSESRTPVANPTESRPTVINRKPTYARWIAVTAGRIGISRHRNSRKEVAAA